MRKEFWILLVIAGCAAPEKKETENLSPLPDKKKLIRVIEAQSEPDSLKGSLQAKAEGTIGGSDVTIEYYSPAVRGRILWGGLVPWDQVWVTGAHNCTRVTFQKDMTVGGRTLAAGTYAFFSIPGKESWTLILNKNFRQHLTDNYDSVDDVVRVSVKPASAPHQERLRYQVLAGENGAGVISVHWEQVQVQLPVGLAESN
jgi:hypothetical protein